ncbi:MAG: hypothetical protein ACREPE_03815 [Lysobacter sp.]
MINRLPPSMPAVPAQPPASRAQTTAPFEGWLSAQCQAPEPGDQHDDPARNPATPLANTTGATDTDTAVLPVAIAATGNADIAAATLAALPQPIDAVFEFHVQREGGSIEVVSVPWRLAGNDMLSRLSPNPAMLTTAQLLQLHASFDPTAGPTPNTPAVPPYAAIARPSPLSLDVGAPALMVLAPGSPARTPSRAVAELAAAAPASMAEPWLARLLRWFEQQGQDPVVWIRDYSLNDDASQAVVNEVRALASQQGWKLQRIVVNAREMWHAPDNRFAEEKSSCP